MNMVIIFNNKLIKVVSGKEIIIKYKQSIKKLISKQIARILFW